MIVLKIILGLIIAVLLFLCLPVVIYMSFSEEFEAEIRILFFKLKIYPIDEKTKEKTKTKPKEKAKEKTGKKPKKAKKPKDESKKKLPEMEFTELVGYALDFLGTIGKYTKKLLRCFLIYDVNLSICICGDDAAQTAIKTGQYNAYFHGVYATLANLFRFKNIKVNIYPDFANEKTEVNFNGKIKVIPLIVLIIAIRLIISFLIKLIGTMLNTKKTSTKNVKKQKAVQKNESSN